MRPALAASSFAGVALAATLASIAVAQDKSAAKAAAAPNAQIERGRYVLRIAGCNDCHTAGYAPSGGKTPEPDWLLGDALGYRGPWGTTYPVNLRRYFSKLTETEWVAIAKTKEMRPPMPYFNLQAMSDTDLRAMYRYVRSLPVKGDDAPAYVPPGQEPKGPFIQWPAPPK